MTPKLVVLVETISRLIGWLYFVSWSLSFYPQPILNFQRRSTKGTTPAYPTINTLGFVAYLTSNLALYASPLIRSQYAMRNPMSPEPTVRLNDVAFGLHAAISSSVTLSMYSRRIWGFKQGPAKVGRSIWAIQAGCLAGVLCTVSLVSAQGRDGGRDPSGWAWIDVVRIAKLPIGAEMHPQC